MARARAVVAPGDTGYGERAWGTAESETEVMVPTSERGEGRAVETAVAELELGGRGTSGSRSSASA